MTPADRKISSQSRAIAALFSYLQATVLDQNRAQGNNFLNLYMMLDPGCNHGFRQMNLYVFGLSNEVA